MTDSADSKSHHTTGLIGIDARSALIGRDRIRGATRMIPEGTEAHDVSAEQIQTVANDVEVFCRNHKIAKKDVAKAIGYSPGVVSEFLAGQYKGASAQVAIDLEAWLSEEEERRSRPSTTQFVWTNVAQEIKSVATYCLDKRKIGLVYGPDTSGIGKTTALQAVYQHIGPRRCSLVTIDKVDANPTGLYRKISKAMRIDDGGSNARRSARIVEELTGRSHLLILDQIHNLRFGKEDQCIYRLMDLWDATKTAQLWCGTADMVSYLHRQERRFGDESLAQVRSRIFPQVDLMEGLRSGGADGGGEPLVTVEQVREMFARNTMRLAQPAARFLAEICNQPDSGALRLCVQIVEYATMMAEIKGLQAIDLPLLKEALRRGFSPKRADDLLNRMHVENQPPLRAAKVG